MQSSQIILRYANVSSNTPVIKPNTLQTVIICSKIELFSIKRCKFAELDRELYGMKQIAARLYSSAADTWCQKQGTRNIINLNIEKCQR